MNKDIIISLDNRMDEVSKEIDLSRQSIKESKDTKISSHKKGQMLNDCTNLWKNVYNILEDVDTLLYSNMKDEYEAYSKKAKSLYKKLKKVEDDLVYDKI